MITTLSARRQAEDLQALLDGRRPSSPTATRDLSGLVNLANALAPADHPPSAEFRSSLRDRLVAAVAARETPVPAGRTRLAGPSRVRQAVAAVVVASAVAGAGAAAASTRALPGDPLYGLKRQVEAVQLALARGDAGKGRELLEQADARLGEAEALTAGEHGTAPETRARVGTALTELGRAASAGADDLMQAYSDTGDPAPLQLLDRFSAQQRQRLDDLAVLLDPALRAQARELARRLAALHDQVVVLVADATATTAPGTALDGPDRLREPARQLAGVGRARATTSPGAPPATATGAVADLAGSLSAGGPAGSSDRRPAGPGPVGGLLGGTTTSSPLPSVKVTVSPPLPLPSPSPLVGDPVGGVTSAVPQPTVSPLPSVPACVAVPPLTTC